MTYVLKYFKDHEKGPLYLAGMSAIGPFTDLDIDKALKFESAQDAMAHPAWCHPTFLCNILEIDKEKLPC